MHSIKTVEDIDFTTNTITFVAYQDGKSTLLGTLTLYGDGKGKVRARPVQLVPGDMSAQMAGVITEKLEAHAENFIRVKRLSVDLSDLQVAA